MMVEPNMDVLLQYVDSKYTLVSVSSKRARKIMEKAGSSLENPVTNALEEIAAGKVFWDRPEETPAAEDSTEAENTEVTEVAEAPEEEANE